MDIRYKRLTYLCIALIVVGSIAGILVPAGIKWDFGNFYDAGRRVLAGEIGNLYSPRTLIGGKSPQATTGFWGTPLTAYLNVPIALLPPIWGMILFKIETAVFSIGALFLLYRHSRRFVGEGSGTNWRFAAIFAFIGLIYQPIWTAFRTGGQTTPLVFFLLTLSVIAMTRERPFAAACFFAFAAMVKPVLITAIVVFTALGGIKYLRYMASIFAVTGLVSVLLLGWDIHQQFLQTMWDGLIGYDSVPWFYNSGLFVTFENLKLYAPPESWPARHATALALLKGALKVAVVMTLALLVYRGSKERWSAAARDHFFFLVSICFFALFGQIVYEAYLTVVFVVLAYLVASERYFGREARVLIAGICLLSFWQNIIWVDLLRRYFNLDSVTELVAIGVFKSAPLILLFVFVVRHQRELLASYGASAWHATGHGPAAPAG